MNYFLILLLDDWYFASVDLSWSFAHRVCDIYQFMTCGNFFFKYQLEKMVCTCEIPDAMLERPSLQDCVAGIPFDVSSATVELCCSTVTQYKDTLN